MVVMVSCKLILLEPAPISFSKLSKQWALFVRLRNRRADRLSGLCQRHAELVTDIRILTDVPCRFYLNKHHFDLLRSKRGKQIALGVLAAVFVICWGIDFDYSFLFGSKPYSSFGDVTLVSGLSRIGWYVLAFGATFSF